MFNNKISKRYVQPEISEGVTFNQKSQKAGGGGRRECREQSAESKNKVRKINSLCKIGFLVQWV